MAMVARSFLLHVTALSNTHCGKRRRVSTSSAITASKLNLPVVVAESRSTRDLHPRYSCRAVPDFWRHLLAARRWCVCHRCGASGEPARPWARAPQLAWHVRQLTTGNAGRCLPNSGRRRPNLAEPGAKLADMGPTPVNTGKLRVHLFDNFVSNRACGGLSSAVSPRDETNMEKPHACGGPEVAWRDPPRRAIQAGRVPFQIQGLRPQCARWSC